jgi:hypothetical protein
MAQLLSVNTRFLPIPLDAVHTDCCMVQLKGYRTKDSFFTIAAFPGFVEAREFVIMFPHLRAALYGFWTATATLCIAPTSALRPAKERLVAMPGGLISHKSLRSL